MLRQLYLDLITAQCEERNEDYQRLAVEFESAMELAERYLPKKRKTGMRTEPVFSIKGGEAGVMMGGSAATDSPQGCFRKAYFRCWGVEPKLDERAKFTFSVGLAQERVYEELHPTWQFGVRDSDPPTISGVPVMVELDALTDKGEIVELKSIMSTNNLKPYLVTGEYKRDNLVQLAYSMAVKGNPTGILRYTSAIYHSCAIAKTEYKFVPGYKRDYVVTFDDSGRFFVDGNMTALTLDSIYRHMEFSAFVFSARPAISEVPRPINTDAMKQTPVLACMYCPYKDVCDAAEACNAPMDMATRMAADILGL